MAMKQYTSLPSCHTRRRPRYTCWCALTINGGHDCRTHQGNQRPRRKPLTPPHT
ncbi:hypothetical protein BJV78DRAFT_1256033 [Lactifluus subvellereus]|nr:hypothetical protein BJV78DRAFT_1256033 [Lactifluus subvellereus]